ncbi:MULTISPECIES: Arm DNA-binding domain-containing protein [Salinivibrio]|uniref:Arm DNA-binding domain-containing protein n=1 Tax=Salinivibrio TaxID=51366 RepID=UPI001F2CD104|nr:MULTISPECIES: Arm DNA-binding domain-containing protein [Salinivibrio]
MGKLYDKTVKKLIREKPSVRHADGNGLYLMTPKRGDAYWMLRYTTPATKLRREYTIGKVEDWSLADARDEAAKLRLAIKREGADPVQERHKVNQNPFKTLNDLYADYYALRKREIASHQKEKSLYEREVAGASKKWNWTKSIPSILTRAYATSPMAMTTISLARPASAANPNRATRPDHECGA